jgi:hypothetical protein
LKEVCKGENGIFLVEKEFSGSISLSKPLINEQKTLSSINHLIPNYKLFTKIIQCNFNTTNPDNRLAKHFKVYPEQKMQVYRNF